MLQERARDAKEEAGQAAVPRRRKNWAVLSDKEVVFAIRLLADAHGIGSKKGLKLRESQAYHAIQKRGLMDEVGFRESFNRWSRMSDSEIIDYARRFIEENGIRNRTGLMRAYAGLAEVLRTRGLYGQAGLGHSRQRWRDTTDEEIIDMVDRSVREKGLRNLADLKREDAPLYRLLLRRGLTRDVGLEVRDLRDWQSMSDMEVLEHAREVVKEGGMICPNDMHRLDCGLTAILKSRGLFRKLGLKPKRRDWSSKDDDEIVDIAKRVVETEGIGSRKRLIAHDPGLYEVLRKRGLVARIGLQRKWTRWSRFSDGRLLEMARSIIDEKGLGNRWGLEKVCSGLVRELRRRGLLDGLFGQKSRGLEDRAIREVVRALEEFG